MLVPCFVRTHLKGKGLVGSAHAGHKEPDPVATVRKASREIRGVGSSVPRYDAPDKVVRKTQYVNDLNLPGMLHTRLLRSPHAHARIKSIDASKARAHKGVRAVLTAA